MEEKVKKLIIFLSVCSLLSACGYSKAERVRLYRMCLQEEIGEYSDVLRKLSVDCACRRWSQREDIDPDLMYDQLDEEYETCFSEPIKLTKEQKDAFVAECVALFTETDLSMADYFMLMGMPSHEIVEMGMITAPAYNIYKRTNNRADIQCACGRMSNLDDFKLPRNHSEWEKAVKENLKVCLE